MREGKFLSATLRELLDRLMALTPGTADKPTLREIRLGFVGEGRASTRDVARRHDCYLWEDRP